jgi:general secretion pathway protein M
LKLEKNDLLKRWQTLSQRERVMALTGAVSIGLYGFYWLIVQPLDTESRLLDQKIAVQEQAYQHLQQVSAEVQALREKGAGLNTDASPSEQSLMTVIDSSSQQLEVKPAIKRLQPEGADTATVWLEQVSFDKLVYWLAMLEAKHGLQVITIDIDNPLIGNGVVNAKLVVGRV